MADLSEEEGADDTDAAGAVRCAHASPRASDANRSVRRGRSTPKSRDDRANSIARSSGPRRVGSTSVRVRFASAASRTPIAAPEPSRTPLATSRSGGSGRVNPRKPSLKIEGVHLGDGRLPEGRKMLGWVLGRGDLTDLAHLGKEADPNFTTCPANLGKSPLTRRGRADPSDGVPSAETGGAPVSGTPRDRPRRSPASPRRTDRPR
jgi:hypothetical protein